MNNLDLKDLVILDVLEYNELMERISKGNKKYYENEKLYKIYEKYYWKNIKEQKTYDLKNIQDYCIKNEGCRNCPFYLGDYECQLRSLFSELDWFPTAWDLEEIECLLKR